MLKVLFLNLIKKFLIKFIVNKQKRIINFLNENLLDQETFNERISLLLDPQTCGPLLISCNKYENVLADKWYKVGEVVKM